MTPILVTGGAGFVGSHTCKALKRAGYRPICYDNLSRGHAQAVKWGELVVGDLADTVALRTAIEHHRPAAVIHFAAFAYVGESVSQPLRYYRNNVVGMISLLEVMRDCGIQHLVFSSSCAVYGVPLSVPILETTPLHPVNPYGATKMICERLLAEHAAMYPLKWLALRYFNVAGCDPEGEIGESHDPETHVIPLLLDTAAGYRDTFAIFGDDYPTPDGTCIRDYIHVADLADAHVLAVADLLRGGESEAVNLGIGRGWSVRELVDVAGEVTGRPIPIQFQPRRAGDPPILVSNPERSKQRLGWQPQFVDVATHIDHAWTWRQRLRGKSFLSA